ncbi:hypothetical protein [Ferrovibrio xuzhouensis]|uniref:Uncharacterized protein n=1 Tax=Ferrovibrio xuzhouensis TaxID=1576914 RepID=A0ABV7VLG7_9PROT
MRRLLQYRYLIAMVLTVAALSGCNKADDYVPGQGLGQAGLIGIGVEVAKIKVERRLEVTCNPLNLLSDGTYCVSNYKPTDRQEVWCFKSLGTVDCYNEPDPYSLAGHQLPAAPRPLADPRMPMTPPGRRTPPQVAVAPAGMEQPVEATPAEPAPTIMAAPQASAPPAAAPPAQQ